MPELPEVETVVRTLESMLFGVKIKDVTVYYPKIVAMDTQQFKHLIIGKSFTEFRRRGKYALYHLEDVVLMVHLRMEGRFYVYPTTHPVSKHTHVVFDLDDGRQLHYHDTRKFGRFELLLPEEVDQRLNHLGPEPNDVTAGWLHMRMSKSNLRLKAFLLDQSHVAGLGNIYADEVIFRVGVHPATRVGQLSLKEIEHLVVAIKDVILQAVALGGTTIRSYTSSLGVSGRFQLSLQVHMKENQPCPVCGTPIIKIRCCGRGTYLCNQCQKVKE